MDKDAIRNIEWDCSRLVLNFYRYLDEKRYDDLAALFDEDGAWERLGEPLVGPQKIRETMNEREDWLTAHVVTNLMIDVVDENNANSVQYITLYRHQGWDESKGPAPVVLPLGVLRHRDALVRVGGEWKFKRKTSRAIMVNRERVTHYDK
ncbi:MAG: hypothetical protein JWQ00_3248 [Noviherbaspirillum sp.]|jgi:hypothetical protein|nr:hypothetical protein [Noviherbaspirillum sp.]